MDPPATKVRKRVREACEPCRRKKNRCPGEKPTCSYCARLGQSHSCTYAGDTRGLSTNDSIHDSSVSFAADDSPHDLDDRSHLEDRILDLDDKLTEVLDQVRSLTAIRPQLSTTTNQERNGHVQPPPSPDVPSSELFHTAAGLYLKYCHCQPLPIFSPDSFLATFAARDLEVRLCIAGVSLRFDAYAGRQTSHEAPLHTSYLNTARDLVMKRVIRGSIELSTLQCLCLLALSDFNTGRYQQSGIYLSLASELARSARLDLFCRTTSHSARTEEHVRCLWSIVLLQYLSGGFGPISVTINTSSLRYPTSDGTNELASTARQSSGIAQETDNDLGIVAYCLKMSEAWHKVRRYVQQRGKIDEYPPWSGQSIYSDIMCRQMEIESQMPHRHRFRPSRFAEHTISDLSANRYYWAPWLYLQIVYHATVCALNHPILLSIHLRRFRVNQVPELFLQQTADLISTHTDWIIHLLQLAREKNYEFSDPFLGQYIAIVATIFLQQSYSQDQNVRREKQERFSICLHFVQDLGRYWPYIEQMAIDLQKFQATLSKAYESSLMENSPELSNLVDLATFWKILDNTLPSSMSTGSRNIFGSSLRPQTTSRVEGEILSTHLLPEPTRVDSVAQTSASNANTPATRNGAGPVPNGDYDLVSQEVQNNPTTDMFLDTPFLAQNFFALGQDFVGNANDWFNWTEV